MSKQLTYSEKLEDPRWQRRRLEILQRDNWTCSVCGDTKTSLQVHHNKYHLEPWDIGAEHLTTLCKNCHSEHHKKKNDTLKDIVNNNHNRNKKPVRIDYFEFIKIDYSNSEKRVIPEHIQWLLKELIKYELMPSNEYLSLNKRFSCAEYQTHLIYCINEQCLKYNVLIIREDYVFGIDNNPVFRLFNIN